MTELSVALATYPHTAALKDHKVEPVGYELNFIDIGGPIVQAFRRMCRSVEFDVSEMAITTYLSAKDNGLPFTAIPVFPARQFSHAGLWVNSNAGITDPKQLEGKKVGMRSFVVTAGVWARGVLADQYGVDLEKVHWIVRDEDHVKEQKLPAGVEMMRDANLTEMLSSGEITATIGEATAETPNVEPLIKDRAEKEKAWMAKGIYPINHTVVVRDSVLAEHPDAASALYNAFVASKQVFIDRLNSGELEEGDKTLAARREAVGPDPIPYGIEANRTTIEALIGFARQQHILTRDFSIEEIFAKGAEG